MTPTEVQEKVEKWLEDLAIPFFCFNQKLKVLWLLIKFSFIQNNDVDCDLHPSGSYQIWIDTKRKH